MLARTDTQQRVERRGGSARPHHRRQHHPPTLQDRHLRHVYSHPLRLRLWLQGLTHLIVVLCCAIRIKAKPPQSCFSPNGTELQSRRLWTGVPVRLDSSPEPSGLHQRAVCHAERTAPAILTEPCNKTNGAVRHGKSPLRLFITLLTKFYHRLDKFLSLC